VTSGPARLGGLIAVEVLDERDDIMSERLGDHPDPHRREAKPSDYGNSLSAEHRTLLEAELLLSVVNYQPMFSDKVLL